jgi:hypothetical protein
MQMPEALHSTNHSHQSQRNQITQGNTTDYYHMVTMYARRHRRAPQSTAHELQQRHLCRRILHSHAIRLELEIRLTTDISSIVRV